MPPPAIADLFQPEWYLRQYPDVAAAGVDPFRHYLLFGVQEGRKPNALFDPVWYAQTYGVAEEPVGHYLREGIRRGLRPHPVLDPEFIRTEYSLAAAADPLHFVLMTPEVDRLSSWFSRRDYLRANPDVAESGMLPEVHFFEHGLVERRFLGVGLAVEIAHNDGSGARDIEAFTTVLGEFAIGGERYQVVSRRMPEAYVAQVREQALIDADVSAIGVECLPYLWSIAATDLERRDLIDYPALLDHVPLDTDAIVIFPRLQIGGAEKYAANLAWGLRQLGVGSVLAVTTDAPSDPDAAAAALELFDGLREVPVAPIGGSIRRTWKPEQVLALLLLRTQPRHVFVINSEVGLQMIKTYGRAVRTVSRLYCAFFSESPFAFGAPYSARYLRDVALHATVLSDNDAALRTFTERLGAGGTARLACLPCFVDVPAAETFDATIAARHARPAAAAGLRLLWVSRWEAFKAVDVLREIALQDPSVTIDAYGPHQEAVPSDVPGNIRLMGPVAAPSRLPLGDYDALIFTSYFEGMPNVVLEMAVAGIPIVASDVGGLRETFSPESIDFVPMRGPATEIAAAFVSALRAHAHRAPAVVVERLRRAREEAERRHGRTPFLERAREIVGET